MPDSTEVYLYNIEGERNKELAKTYVVNNSFEFCDSIESPVVCEINIGKGEKNAKGNYPAYAAVRFMLENENYNITSQHLDSLPLSYSEDDSYCSKEHNLKIKGGKAQIGYQLYRTAIAKEDKDYSIADRIYMNYFFSGDGPRNMDSLEMLKNAEIDAKKIKEDKELAFAISKPELAISAYILNQQVASKFRLTEEEYDTILSLMQSNPDTVRVSTLHDNVEKYRKYARRKRFNEFKGIEPDGKDKSIAIPMSEGKYTIIDFWASWCGPCKSAIPQVKSIYEKYKGNTDVLSISLDQKMSDWQKALEEEDMDWQQVMLGNDSYNEIVKRYGIQSIPCLMVINLQGEIEVVTHAPYVIESFLAETLNN